MANANSTRSIPGHLIDLSNMKLGAAMAILDCVRVVAAYEKQPDIPHPVQLNDDSMTDAVWHAMELIREVRSEIEGE